MSGWGTVFRSRGNKQSLQQVVEAAVKGVLQQQQPRKRFRQDEWCCAVCLTYNFDSRKRCRNCGDCPGTAHAPLPKHASQTVGARRQTPPVVAKSAVQAAKAAGASDETLASLEKDLSSAKKARTSFGAQLDSAEAKARKTKDAVRKAEVALEKAQEALKKAEEALQTTKDAADLAEGELRSLREGVNEQEDVVVEEQSTLLTEVQRLLETLDSSPLVASSSLHTPDKLLDRVSSLRRVFEGLQPQQSVQMSLDDRLVPLVPLRRGRCDSRAGSEPSVVRVRTSSRTPPPSRR